MTTNITTTINNDTYGFASISMASGMVVAQVCPACGKKHNGQSRPKCSKIKQQMYRDGKL